MPATEPVTNQSKTILPIGRIAAIASHGENPALRRMRDAGQTTASDMNAMTNTMTNSVVGGRAEQGLRTGVMLTRSSEFALMIGVSVATLRNWERADVRLKVLRWLCSGSLPRTRGRSPRRCIANEARPNQAARRSPSILLSQAFAALRAPAGDAEH